MIAARVATALGDAAAVVAVTADGTGESALHGVRAAVSAGRESVLVIIEQDVAAIHRAMLRAAIGPLAIESAPASRINALDIAAGAAADAVIAAAIFLAHAHSTTGQVIEVSL
ncbi:MAG: Rossmann fold domain-containing protein [Sphingomonas sp.]|uniref:Rossmann fold domain-containing protein n=1 Tax=Sphingomonas sp. TaxID=28214 RepID=UPI0035643CF5